MKLKMRAMGAGGDTTIAEWDTDTVTAEQLDTIEKEFNRRMEQGWFAADVRDQKNVLIKEFDLNADILLIPRVMGG